MKTLLRFVLALSLLISFPALTHAADLSPTYSESVQLAQDHAANPAGWTAPSLFVIPDGGGTAGLTYDGANLIVRTATKSRIFTSNYVGQAGYKIYGPATTDAAWVTTGNDATKFLLANGVTGANVTKLIERGLGMDTAGTHDAIVEYAADTQYLMRPTRNPDITQYLPVAYGDSASFVKPAGMSDAAFNNFKAYYENWKIGAYGQYPFPWTQLGYTFFWGNGYSLANIKGMSEFILLGQTPVTIYGIYATQSYVYTRNDGTAFSSAATAQFGNGFASFKIDGSCDTVWAGHRFQKNVRTATATPNEIRIESGGTVSGGQGLLVWSLNYDVNNSGVISGATSKKFGINGTENVAVLFKGDTSTSYGTPIAAGSNRLTNSGTISSPGTAIKAEAGDTIITNNAGGVISGGTYAIQTGTGNDTVTVNGGDITGSIDLGAGTDTLNVTGAGSAKLNFTLNRDTSSTAQVANTETVTIANNTTLGVRVGGTKNIRNNDRFLIVDATTLTVNETNLTIQNDSAVPMLTFAAQKIGSQLSLVASRDGTYYGRNSGNASLGTLLDSLAETATGDMATVLGSLDSSGSAGNARKLEPTVNGGTVQASYGTIGQFTNTVISRIDQVWSGSVAGTGPTGISTSDEPAKWGVWSQAFGAYLNQGARGSSSAYSANLWGGSLGFDRLLFDHFMFGLSGGYARNYIRTNDANTRADADSYQGSLYGSLARDSYYIDGVLSYAYNRYDAQRHIAFGTTDRVAKSNYEGQQYSGYLEGGYTLKNRGLNITPLVSLQYMRLHLNDYSESGAGSLNLTVDAQDYNTFQSGLGAKLAYPILLTDSQIVPEVHVKWLYDFIGDQQQATSTFTGSGASFSTKGFDPPKSSYNAGAKLTLMTKYDVTLSLNYDFEMKEDFSSHTGYVNVRYVF
jgi:outer membrane autotransporter protein